MNLLNKKLVLQKYSAYSFPEEKEYKKMRDLIEKWQYALKDRNLDKTKEKSIQGKFLSTFFEEILGYKFVTSIEKEEEIWTIIQHPNIENNTGEPDGSLGFFSNDIKDTRVVIELKDAKTSLDKKQNRAGNLTPVEQAYRYANKEDKCKWIIVSNFREIRLYSKNRSEFFYEKFKVLDLDKENEFKRFFFLLNRDNLISKDGDSIVDVLASETVSEEQDITKKFYSEYKELRLNLLNHLIENNKGISQSLLLEKTQKLLDRLIFVLFCENTADLLPVGITKKTYNRAINSFASGDERVWNEFKGLFEAVDRGRETPHINAYNGGLFKKDEVFDSLSIKDSFWKELIKLADYDYQTDLNVNILGHIFEQSISDLEELKESILLATEGGSVLTTEDHNPISIGEKVTIKEKKGKRKRDGIYYTPEYITKYIVDEAVGAYLEDNPEKLESIKVLDPACGSGAFPNQVHTYLSNQYKIRHEELINRKKEEGEAVTLFDYNPVEVDRSILLNNIFGVDLNRESIEISKLALWLKTATKEEPLQNLDNNFKTGNSLIDDVEIAGDKAFNWRENFPEIFESNNGFDVIVANPPYVNIANIKNEKQRKYLQENYSTVLNKSDLYSIFVERSVSLLRDGGYLGFVFSDSWMGTQSFRLFREFLLENLQILKLVKLPTNVFHDATVKTVILIAKKKKVNKHEIKLINAEKLLFEEFSYGLKYEDIRKTPSSTFTFRKIPQIEGDFKLSEKVNFSLGIKTSDDKKFILNFKKDDDSYPLLRGRNIDRYCYTYTGEYIWYKPELMKQKKGAGPRKLEYFKKGNVLIQDIANKIIACIDREGYLVNDTVSVIYDTSDLLPETLVALLNSKLINKWFKAVYPAGLHIKTNQLKTIPIKNEIYDYQLEIRDYVLKMEDVTKKYILEKEKTISFIEETYNLQLSTKEKEGIDELGWNIFFEEHIKELSDLSISKKEEFHGWFRNRTKALNEKKQQRKLIQQEIDNCIFKIYDISE
jgi:type I restriction-modification system DNA methylase subunit